MICINKRGISQIVAFVLLISFAVGLGTIVMMWYTSTTEKQSATMIGPAEGNIDCENANLNIRPNYDDCTISVFNTGTVTIHRLKFTPQILEDSDTVDVEIKPIRGQHVNVTVNTLVPNSEGLEVIQSIKVNNQVYTCTEGRTFQLKQSMACGS